MKAAGFAVIVSKVPSSAGRSPPQVVSGGARPSSGLPADVIAACERLRSGMNDPETVTPTRAPSASNGRPAARLDFQGYVDGASSAPPRSAPSRTAAPSWWSGQALAAEFDADALTFDTILRSFRLR